MAVPTILTDQSVGAPSLTGEDGSLYGVLKWALPQLGWTLEFDDATNFHAAFRNNAVSGSGKYLKIVDKAADHASTSIRALVQCFQSMSAINTGVGPFPTTELYWMKSDAATSATRAYHIIGNSEFFWFLPKRREAAPDERWFFFAGDYIRQSLSDNDSFVVGGSANTGTGTAVVSAWPRNVMMSGAGPTNYVFAGASDFDASTSVGLFIYSPNVNFEASKTMGYSETAGVTMNDPVTGGITTAPAYFVESSGSPTRYAVRGRVPGVLNPQGNFIVTSQSTYVTGDTETVPDASGAVTAMFFGTTVAFASGFDVDRQAFFISTSDWG